MSIVFGWYSFKIKSYKPKELGIEDEGNEDVTFEVRQKCFHLFWIPFFSLGKIYAIRRKGELYEMPDGYISFINNKDRIRSPWYTYSIFVLVLVCYLGFLGMNKISDYNDKLRKENEYKELISKIDYRLNHLEVGNYIYVRGLQKSIVKYKYLKIVNIDGEQIDFVSTQDRNGHSFSNPYYINTYFNSQSNQLDTLSATISQFKQMVCRDSEAYYKRHDVGFPIFKDNDMKYVMREIGDLEGPILGVERYTFNNAINLFNFGSLFKLTKIEDIEGKSKWDVDLPLYYPTDSVYSDRSNEGKITCLDCSYNKFYKIRITVVDTTNTTYNYVISKFEGENSIEKQYEI